MTLNQQKEYWKRYFPNTWKQIVDVVWPFYAVSSLPVVPVRPSAERELLDAIAAIAPGDLYLTPLGQKKKKEDIISDLKDVVLRVSSFTPSEPRHYSGSFGSMVHNHVGSIHDDLQPGLHRAYFGRDPDQSEFNVQARVHSLFREALIRLDPNKATDHSFLVTVAGSMSTIVFMGIHFASVGDNKRDFSRLLTFLRRGNVPLGMSARRAEPRTLLLLCSD